MSVTIGGVACEELVGGYGEGASRQNGPGARKGYLCAWNDCYALMKGLLGYSGAPTVGGVITFNSPATHPRFPDAFASNVAIEGVGMPKLGPLGLEYPYAKVWVDYAITGYAGGGQLDPKNPLIYAEQTINTGVTLIEIPEKACKFATSGKPPKLKFAIRIPTATLTITLKNLPYIPVPTIVEYGGSINDTTFLNVAPGSLMFDGISTREAADVSGKIVQEATYQFQYRAVRWDYDYDPDQDDFDLVLKKNGDPFLIERDFDQIIPSYYYSSGLY